MPKRFRRLPSPALVVASIALGVALGGTSVAAVTQIPRSSVGTAQLKNGAVTSPKIRTGAVTSSDVRNGTLRRVDFRPGQLPAGPQGPQGPPGLSAREQVSAETALTSGAPKTVTATCPAGKKVIGGGAEVSGAGRARVTVTENHAVGDTAWEVEAFEAVATPAAWKVIVHAICANVT
jgi:hypothetical protein